LNLLIGYGRFKWAAQSEAKRGGRSTGLPRIKIQKRRQLLHCHPGPGISSRQKRSTNCVCWDWCYRLQRDGGPATSAELNLNSGNGFTGPSDVAVDGAGNLFIADTVHSRVRRVDAATGIITTVAGGGTAGPGDGGPATSAVLGNPSDVAVDSAGNLFITEIARIRRVDATTQVITTVAGNGTSGYSGDGGPATSAELNAPSSVAFDNAGNLLFCKQGVGGSSPPRPPLFCVLRWRYGGSQHRACRSAG
jgi:hypothetical protein